MARSFDLARLTDPVSPGEPCGPDLDLAGDSTFMQVQAGAEGVLPTSFFKLNDEGQLQAFNFDRSKVDVAVELRRLGDLLAQTRDLRLLTLYGRISALNRDLRGFGQVLAAVAALLDVRWDEVHPQADEGDFSLRSAVVQSLDDLPTVVLPIQHIPLLNHRRFGPVSFRTVMAVEGEVAFREGEAVLDRSALSKALADADLDDLRATCDAVMGIRDAARLIHARNVEQVGHKKAVSLDGLSALAAKMADLLEPVIASRDPGTPVAPAAVADTTAETGETARSPAPRAATPPAVGHVTSRPAAAAALAAVASYFRQQEPSSPAEALIRQAARLVGKSFVDVLRALLPAHAEETRIALGPDNLFTLTFQQLVDASEEAAQDEGTPVEEPGEVPAIRVSTRQEAIELTRQVSLFYRATDPASPIPLLLDRATGLASRDFVTILGDVLPGLVKRDY